MDTPQQFVDADMRGAHFDRALLGGAVMRGVDVDGLDIDAPWLHEGGTLLVNGVDVAPFVNAELDRRFPGRELRFAATPDDLRAAWGAVERAWEAAVERASALPADAVDVQVAGEWSFAQTLRHLVMATDTWLGRAVLGEEEPYHRLGLPHAEYAMDGHDVSIFADGVPPYSEVLAARADRSAKVRSYLAGVTDAELAAERSNVWAPEHTMTVLLCLQTILGEEWEHLRFATRDLAALQAEHVEQVEQAGDAG